MKNPTYEATKTILRPFVFAVGIAVVETILQQLKVWKLDATSVTLLTAVFTWLDNYLHEKRKIEKTYTERKALGILWF